MIQFGPKELEEFRNNLKKVSDFTHMELVSAMEICQALVVNEARSDHPKFMMGTIGHPYSRYYTRMGHLTNSIRNGEVNATKENIIGEIKAGDTTLAPYAAFVESRYPFMDPALEATRNEILNILADAVRKVIK